MKQPPVIDEQSRWQKALNDSVSVSDKNWWTTFFLSLFFGCFGFDRFYLGQPMLGLLKFFSMGYAGFGWAIDFILVCAGMIKDADGMLVRRPKRQ